jgi:putative ABC transport system permease protein
VSALRSRLRFVDAAALGAGGLRSRPLRACLSALGIAIGIAAAVAVLGISASSRAGLLAQLASEDNLLTVTAGRSFTGEPASLPLEAEGMIRRIPPVESASGVGFVQGATVRRSPAVNRVDTGGIAVLAAQPSLLGTLDGSVLHGTFLNDATVSFPAVVLGFNAAQSLGLDRVPPGEQVDLAGNPFTVIGILRPVPVAPEIDSAGLGAAAVAVTSAAGHQPVALPAVALVGGLATAAVVGTVAGAYPALRAARLTPTEALRSA